MHLLMYSLASDYVAGTELHHIEALDINKMWDNMLM